MPPVRGEFVEAGCVDFCRLTIRGDDGRNADFIGDFESWVYRIPPGTGIRLELIRLHSWTGAGRGCWSCVADVLVLR